MVALSISNRNGRPMGRRGVVLTSVQRFVGPTRNAGVSPNSLLPVLLLPDDGPRVMGWPPAGSRAPQRRRARLYPLHCKADASTMFRMAVTGGRRSQLLRGVLDLCLLAVMDEGAAYGYEMTKRLAARGLSIVGEGSIYPLLGRLERDGLVDTRRAISNGGPPRKYYSLSRQGRRALAAGVSEWQATRDAVDSVLGQLKEEVG